METLLYKSVDTGMRLSVWQKDVTRCKGCLPLPLFPLLQAVTYRPFWYCSTWSILPETHSHCPNITRRTPFPHCNSCFMLKDKQKAKAGTQVAETEIKHESSTHEGGRQGFRKHTKDFPSCSNRRASLIFLSLSQGPVLMCDCTHQCRGAM